MNHSGETKKHRLGRKQFILLIVSVCLVALLAEAVLLIHTFLKKKKPAAKEMQPEEPKTYVKQTVRRVSKATWLINEREAGTVEFAYDEYGRVSRAEYKENGSNYSKAMSYTYFQGDCSIVVYYLDGFVTGEYFVWKSFMENERIWAKIIDYDADGSGRLVKMKTSFLYGEDFFTFDPKGRPIQYGVYEDGVPMTRKQLRYDDSGKLEQIIYGNGDTADIVYDAMGRAMVTERNSDGEVFLIKIYLGNDLIYEMVGVGSYCRHYYYPKDKDLLPGIDSVLKELLPAFDIETFFPGFEIFTSLDGKERYRLETVEFTEDDQPLQNFYSDGALHARYIYDENGRVSGYREMVKTVQDDIETTYEWGADFTFDEKGNIVTIAEYNVPRAYQFEWIEMEALVEQE